MFGALVMALATASAFTPMANVNGVAHRCASRTTAARARLELNFFLAPL